MAPRFPTTSGRAARVVAPALAALLAAGCGSLSAPPTSPAQVPELRPGSGYLIGYLPRKELPNSLALLPPPPAAGSARAAADEEARRAAQAQRGTPRWTQAIADANLMFPAAADTFSCVLGLPISEQGTPHLNMLLRRSLADAGLATYAAKDHYQRTRPFVVHKETTCTPAEEAMLSKDGSYPSGHSAVGWAAALILVQLAPERTDAILARGYAFGQSRVVCNVHWQSDVDAGRVIASAAVARLQSDPVFRRQLRLARAEVADARARGLKSTRDCAAEASALASGK